MKTLKIETAVAAGPSSGTNTLVLLTFRVGGQIYGFPVTSVVRIIEMVTITSLPNAPDTIRGIINVQGKAVPVIDLRHHFGLPVQAYGLHTPIILVDLDNSNRILGLIVDIVEDVLNIPYDHLEMTETMVPAELAGQMADHAAHLAGVAKVNRQMILILNTYALLTPTEQTQLSEVLDDDVRPKVQVTIDED